MTMPRFDLEQFLGLIAGAPRDPRSTSCRRSSLALAKHPMVDDYDLSSVRSMFSGAAPLGAELGRGGRRAHRRADRRRATA